MTSLDVALVTAVVLLTVLVAALLRSHGDSLRRLELVERRLARAEKRDRREPAPATPPPVPAQVVAEEPDGDAVDIRGTGPAGEPVTIALEESSSPTLVAFLSTGCGTCTTIWTRLRDEGLAEVAPGVRPVVVVKDARYEDPEAVRRLADGSDLPVALSSEAWVDYEVPGSPYLMLVSPRPGSVVAESSVHRWDDVVAMARRAAAHSR